MALTSGYFNSVDGDRKYNAETMSNYFEGLICDGVYNSIGDKFKVTYGDDLSVNVGTGRAMQSCRWIRNTSTYNVELQASDVQMQRYDAIVLRLDLNDTVRDFTIEVKTGTSALANPTKPSVTNTALVKELCLAYVFVDANVHSIHQSNIEDMRGSSLCPWVTGLIEQVDTSTLFSQFETAYNELYSNWASQFESYLADKKTEFEKWFSNLESTLGVNLALKTYQNIVITAGTTTELNVGIPEFLDGDVLIVHSNGLLLSTGLDYTTSGEGTAAKVTFTNGLETGNTVTFTVIKASSST